MPIRQIISQYQQGIFKYDYALYLLQTRHGLAEAIADACLRPRKVPA